MKKLHVIAPPDRICPKEGGKPAGVITDKEPAAVPDTAYYRRLLKEGSLLDGRKHKTEKTEKKGG